MLRNPMPISTARRRLIDETIDAYVDWREECARVLEAYHCWLGAPEADTALSFWAYMAALDREERASEVYAELIGRLETASAICAPESLAEGLTDGDE
jgi:hypothetical protein